MPVYEDPNPIAAPKPTTPWWLAQTPKPKPPVIGPARRPAGFVAPRPPAPVPIPPVQQAPAPKPPEAWLDPIIRKRIETRLADTDAWRAQQIERATQPSAVTLKTFSARSANAFPTIPEMSEKATDWMQTWSLPRWMPDWLEGVFKQGVEAVAQKASAGRDIWIEAQKAAPPASAYGNLPGLFAPAAMSDHAVWRMTNEANRARGKPEVPPPTATAFELENARRVQNGLPVLPDTMRPAKNRMERASESLVQAVNKWAGVPGAPQPQVFGPQPKPTGFAPTQPEGIKAVIAANVAGQQHMMAQGPAGVLLTVASLPYSTLVEPVVADWWTRVFLPQRDNFLTFFNQDYKSWGDMVGSFQVADAKARQLQATIAQYPMYGTLDEIMTYRATAPWYVQLAAGAVLDPLNLVGAGLTKFAKSRAAAASMREVSAISESIETVAKTMMDPHPPQWWDRAPLMRITNEAKADALVTQAIDVTNNLHQAGGDFIQMMTDFVRDPDSLAPKTGGYSSALKSKQTAVLLRKVIGVDSAGNPNFALLQDALGTGTDLDGVVELASSYRKAAESVFPPQRTQNAATQFRNRVYDVATAAYLGWSPQSAARNALNNVFTMTVDGYNPFSRTAAAAEFLDRWGPMPVAGKQAMGAGGEVWMSRANVESFLADLQKPSRWRDIWKIPEKGRTAPFLALGQNIERVASDKIVTQALRNTWSSAWRNSMRDFELKLTDLGLPEPIHNYVMRRMRGSLNEGELRKIWRELEVELTPPPGGGGVPLPAAPSPVVPPGAAPVPGVPPSITEITAAWPNPLDATEALAREPWMMPAAEWSQYDAVSIGDTPPTVDAALLAWHEKQVQRAVRNGLPVPDSVRAAYDPLFDASLPHEVASRIEEIAGPEAAELAETITRGADTPAMAKAALETIPEILETEARVVELEQRVREIVETAPEMTSEGLIAHIGSVSDLMDKHIKANYSAQSSVREAIRGLGPTAKGKVWSRYWNTLLKSNHRAFESVHAAMTEIADRAGLGAEFVAHSDVWLEDVKVTWEKHVSTLEAMLERVKALEAKRVPYRDQVRINDAINAEWEGWKRSKSKLWADYGQRKLGYEVQYVKDIREAIGTIEGARRPPGEAAPVAPKPPPTPAAPLAWDDRVTAARATIERDTYLTREQRDSLKFEQPEAQVWFAENKGPYQLTSSKFREWRNNARKLGADLKPKPAPAPRAAPAPAVAPAVAAVDPDVVEALQSLNFTKAEAVQAATGLPADMPLDEKIAAAIKTRGAPGEAPVPPAPAVELPPGMFTENTPATLAELRKIADDNGIPTFRPDQNAPQQKQVRDAAILKAASKYLGRSVKELAELTPNEMNIVADRLLTRLGKKLEEDLSISEAMRLIDEGVVSDRDLAKLDKAPFKEGQQVKVGGVPRKLLRKFVDPDGGHVMYDVEGVTRPMPQSKIQAYVPPVKVANQLTGGAYGRTTSAFGGLEGTTGRTELRWKVVSLDDLIPSHLDDIDTPNPKFPPELQNRSRNRYAAQEQVTSIQNRPDWERFYTDTRSLLNGSPIIGPDNLVEGGNGRVLGMRAVRSNSPQVWAEGQIELRQHAADLGIDPKSIENMPDVVFVRERTFALDDAQRQQFVRVLNDPEILSLSPAEIATDMARQNGPRLLALLQTTEDATIEAMLRSEANKPFMDAYVRSLPKGAQATVADARGNLSAQAIEGAKGAILATVYEGPRGQRLLALLTESMEPTVKAVETSIMGSLGDTAKIKARIAGGTLPPWLNMSDEIMDGALLWLDTRKDIAAAGGVDRFVEANRKVLVPREFTPPQVRIMRLFDNYARTPAKLRDIMREYAKLVDDLPNYAQKDMLRSPTEFDALFPTDETLMQQAIVNVEKKPPSDQSTFMFSGPGFLMQPAVGKKIRDVWTAGLDYADPLMQRAGTLRQKARDLRKTLTGFTDAPAQPLPRVSAADRIAVRNLIEDQAVPSMVRDKAFAGNVATKARHFALGDYTKQRDIHDAAKWLYMYPTWYGFTYANWAKRFAQRPALLANYARYKQILYEENLKHYREKVGDPNAALPPQYENQVRIDVFGNEYVFNMEQVLNPLYGWMEHYRTVQQNEAPGGALMNTLTSLGPGLFTPISLGYAGLLRKAGYNDAAEQTVGYMFPQTQPIKSATAWLANALPATRAVIPPGGINLEGWLNPNVANGSYWERQRIGYFLVQAWRDGKITTREMQDAAGTHSGTAWQNAMQAEAVSRAPSNVFGFLSGLRIYQRTDQDYYTSAMWSAWADIFDKNLPPEQLSRALDSFDQQYPFAKSLRASRTQDPTARLEDYAHIVMDRYGPNWQKEAFVKELDPTGLVGKFYRTGGLSLMPADTWGTKDQETWTPVEVDMFGQIITELARRKDVPSQNDLTDFDEFKRADDVIKERALDAVNTKQPANAKRTIEDMKAQQTEYFRLQDLADGGRFAKAYLASHPELKAWWEAQDEQQQQLNAGKWRIMSPDQQMPDNMAEPAPVAGMKPEERAQAEGFIIPGDNWKEDLGNLGVKVPQAFINLQSFDWRKGATPEQIDLAAQEVQSWFETLPAGFRAKWLDVGKMQTAKTAQDRLINTVLPVEMDQYTKGDGKRFVDWYYSYYLGVLKTSEERAAYRKSHPLVADAIYAMYDFLDAYAKQNPEWGLYYGYTDSGGFTKTASGAPSRITRTARRRSYYSGGGGYSGGGYSGGGGRAVGFPAPTPQPGVNLPPTGFPTATPMSLDDYTKFLTLRRQDMAFDPLAKLMFGKDIFAIADEWYRLTPNEQAAWQQQNDAKYTLLLRYLQWLARVQDSARGMASIPAGVNPASRPPAPSPRPSRG